MKTKESRLKARQSSLSNVAQALQLAIDFYKLGESLTYAVNPDDGSIVVTEGSDTFHQVNIISKAVAVVGVNSFYTINAEGWVEVHIF